MTRRNPGEMTDEMTNMKLRTYADADAHDNGGVPKFLWWIGDNGHNTRTLCKMPIKPTVTILNADPSAPGMVHNNYIDRVGSTELRGQALRDWCDYSLDRALGKEAHEPGRQRSPVARSKRMVHGKTEKASQDIVS